MISLFSSQQDTYEVQVVDGEVFVKNDTPFATEKPTSDTKGRVGISIYY